MTRSRLLFALAVLAAVTLVTVQPGRAASVSYTLDTEFSSSAGPQNLGSDAPTATFTDTGANQVTLTLDNNFSIGGFPFGKVFGMYFNVVESFIPSLGIAFSSGQNANAAPVFVSNNYQADGDGFFDLLISFASGGLASFDDNETSVWIITCTGCVGFDANAFSVLSNPAPGGGAGPFFAAAHIGGLPLRPGRFCDDINDDALTCASGWYRPGNGGGGSTQVPEPAVPLLLGAGLAAVAAFARWRTRGK